MAPTALGAGLLACLACRLVSRPAGGGAASLCPRCGARLHPRRPDSVARTWALLLTAAVLYVPANVLPVLESSSLFGVQRDTILSGIAYLWATGSWALAALVFFASVVVPLAKILGLGLLLVLAQRRSRWQPAQRTRLYRIIEFFGRWSMIDIYVVAMLVALVQVGAVASLRAGPGALAFGLLVATTMFAAMSFDPRLTWDAARGDGAPAPAAGTGHG